MRYFNTSGPCNPAEHYTVMREALIAQGQILVDRGRYFTIFAPRQAGKTTYFQLLLQKLKQEVYTPIWISFEGFKFTVDDPNIAYLYAHGVIDNVEGYVEIPIALYSNALERVLGSSPKFQFGAAFHTALDNK